MALKVVGISTSPRVKSNSDLLLRKALAGAESCGAQVEYISLREKKVAACIECNECYKAGQCVIEDDYHAIITKILDADRLILATPVFFMTVCSQCKVFIDRCQNLWARKYILKKPLFESERDRRGMVIAVGGTRGTKMFESIRLTMKYFFDVLDMELWKSLLYRGLDFEGDAEKQPEYLAEAREAGKALAGVL